ncbi:MAG TPA: BBE domain-containing protein, partial [Solirubrobacteraceae bacterium]|nr:BBE domain-containing protein [Solirubrobacteraceae bacterium]
DRSTMALEIPDVPWFYHCEALWTDQAHAATEPDWAREFMQTMLPWAVSKAPPNFISADDGHGRLRASYGEEKFARLVALKDRWDPDNVFALNQNIPPSRVVS